MASSGKLDWGQPGCTEPAREKGVDVALAVDLVRMAIGKEYEVGIVFSRDTELEPAIDLALKLGAHTEVATWAGGSRISLPGRSLF
ncbi:MAG: NYN domain-containing protein [Candidatus Nanopelagicales bacterium]